MKYFLIKIYQNTNSYIFPGWGSWPEQRVHSNREAGSEHGPNISEEKSPTVSFSSQEVVERAIGQVRA